MRDDRTRVVVDRPVVYLSPERSSIGATHPSQRHWIEPAAPGHIKHINPLFVGIQTPQELQVG